MKQKLFAASFLSIALVDLLFNGALAVLHELLELGLDGLPLGLGHDRNAGSLHHRRRDRGVFGRWARGRGRQGRVQEGHGDLAGAARQEKGEKNARNGGKRGHPERHFAKQKIAHSDSLSTAEALGSALFRRILWRKRGQRTRAGNSQS